MKCSNCGHENKNSAKFCTKCGKPMGITPEPQSNGSDNSKFVILALLVVIVILVAVIGFFAVNMMDSSHSDNVENDASQPIRAVSEPDDSDNKTVSVSSPSQSTTSEEENTKSWKLIGSYSGSGSGSQVINVPDGQVRVELSAFPIKNYATNHLYVTGSNGDSGGVDWGPESDVETRSDSFEYTSSDPQAFTIDYYETVSWEVEFYRYQ